MGTTGSGKSSFIQAITGRDDIVGNSLQSGTLSAGMLRGLGANSR